MLITTFFFLIQMPAPVFCPFFYLVLCLCLSDSYFLGIYFIPLVHSFYVLVGNKIKLFVASMLGSLSHSLLDLSLWKNPAATLWGDPVKRTMWVNLDVDLLKLLPQPHKEAQRESLPQSSLETTTDLSDWHLDFSLLRDQKPEPPSKAALRFLTHRNCKINVYCFQLLNFGITYYTAIGN